MKWLWPQIASSKEAIDAAFQSALWAFLVASITAIIAVVAIFVDHPVIGLDGWALIDAGLFAIIGWRVSKLSLPWAVFGLLYLGISDAVKLSDGKSPGIMGLIILFGFVSGVRGTWFIWREKKKSIPTTPMAAPVAPPPPPPNLVKPLWMSELPGWAAVRLADEDLTTAASAQYCEELFESVRRLRTTVLTEIDFARTCRVTAQALLLRTQLMVTGLNADVSAYEILVAMFAVFPEYQSFYRFEDVIGDSISLRDFGKLQMFEAEMFSVLASNLLGESEWLGDSIKSMNQAAHTYWEDHATRLDQLDDVPRSN